MLRNRLLTGVAVLVLLGAIAGCGGDLEPPPEAANTLERTIEETIVVLEQPVEEADVDLEQTGETNTFTLQGWVTVDAYHYDEATGTYIHFYHDESSNLIVDTGLEWIELQLGSDSPGAISAQYISLSTNTGSPVAGWTVIPGEIVADGLERALGIYGSTGTGAWEIVAIFDATATHTAVQLSGLQWDAGPPPDTTLLAANTFLTPVTLNDGDRLTVTWSLSVSSS